LIDYEGALVLITHDRHLIRSVVNRIVEVKAGAVQEFDGDYDYYLGKRRPDDVEEEQRPAAEKPKISRKEERRIEAEHRARTKRLRDRVRTIEEELDELRAANARIEVVLGDPDAYSSGVDIAETVHEYEVNKRRAELLEEEWAEASTDLERADQESAGSSSTIR
jgi:ATP-binding cassette subfamily F protein 3